MGRIATTPVHRGWRLLAAYNAYLILTERLNRTGSIKRLDINQAYALLSHCGFMTQANGVELQRKECPVCSIRYPIVINEQLALQGCPVCAINANCLRLSDQAVSSRRTDTASPTS
jgi:hypothetical protein